MKRLAWFVCAWLSLSAGHAHARVDRFALLIGNNLGVTGETPLRYAESDALRMYDVLLQLGDFSAQNVRLLRGEDAATARSALIALNERIRDSMPQPGDRAVLVVYYSGHADAQALHLGDSLLPLAELRQLARGSAASFRLVVLDACRSGSLTRVKGGRRVRAFEVNALSESGVPNDGTAFLTASSAREDAQESDELQSAFFTHAFVSGLYGAADGDGDGAVVLDEAYRYAYAATLRTTSRTLAGAQHPTFHYDLRGRGQLVLTQLRAHSPQRAVLDFPVGAGFLLLRGSADGPVVVELEREAQGRKLTIDPGRYFVRGRAADVLYEGYIDAQAGTLRALQLAELDRIDYARLVRKRGGARDHAHGLELGSSFRSALPNTSTPCIGGFAGYGVDWSSLGARVRFGSCVSQLQNRNLSADVVVYDLALSLYRAWDSGWFTFELGLGAGLTFSAQSFQTRGRAVDQLALAPFASLTSAAEANFAAGWYARLEASLENHWLRMVDRAGERPQARAAFALRSTLGIGKRF